MKIKQNYTLSSFLILFEVFEINLLKSFITQDLLFNVCVCVCARAYDSFNEYSINMISFIF